MGGGTWDPQSYRSSSASRTASGIPHFQHDDDVRTGRATGIHSLLDPKALRNGLRESCDSDEHPDSVPIVVAFDVTGSMGTIPQVLREKLVKLMDVIHDKAELRDPQILMSAIGDATCDQYPFQVGQFESDNRFEEQLRQIILEGNGGGQQRESYGLAHYFVVNHVVTDAWRKRGRKGYLFTMGDEGFWPTTTRHEIKKIFDVDVESDIDVAEMITRAKEQWEVFHLFSKDGAYPDSLSIRDQWRAQLGERFVIVEDSSLVCEIIASLILANEKALDADSVVKDLGLSGSAANAVRSAIVPFVASRLPANVAKGNLPAEADSPSDSISRV